MPHRKIVNFSIASFTVAAVVACMLPVATLSAAPPFLHPNPIGSSSRYGKPPIPAKLWYVPMSQRSQQGSPGRVTGNLTVGGKKVLVVGVHDITPPNSSVTWKTATTDTKGNSIGVGLYQTSSKQVDWWHQLYLPAGARLLRLELEACDSSSSAQIIFGISRGSAPAGSSGNISIVTTGGSAAPGCAFYIAEPNSPVTINNVANNYWVFFSWKGSSLGKSTTVHSLRIYYKPHFSPLPATPTFNDVSKDYLFYRAVEALAASGITGGCGGGNFCPNAPVTRGQMAAFLTRALGL